MAIDHFKDPRSQGKPAWWNFNVIFDNQPAVQELAKSYAAAIAPLGLHPPVPPKWLHSTILAVGPVTDYTEQEMMAVARLLEPSLSSLKLPEFMFDSWLTIGGVVLHIAPEDQFTKIYNCVVVAMEAVVGPDRTRRSPHGNFLAHMTLAYGNEQFNEPETMGVLAAHAIHPVKFTDLNIALIKQIPKDGHYQWSVVKELSIGSAEA